MLPALRRLLARAGGTRLASSKASARVAPAGGRDSFEESVLFMVFSSNIAGIICARTIHYQFFSW